MLCIRKIYAERLTSRQGYGTFDYMNTDSQQTSSYADALNDPLEVKLRRCRSNLALGGAAYIVFGIWAVIKILAELTMEPIVLEELLQISRDQGFGDEIIKPVYAVMFAIMFFVIIIVHLYIGFSAIRYSAGRKRSFFFLVYVAGLISFASNDIKSYLAKSIGKDFFTAETTIAAICADITMIFLLLDLIVCVIQIRALKKDIAKRGEQG